MKLVLATNNPGKVKEFAPSSACMSYLNGDKTPQQSKMQTGSQTTGPGPCFFSTARYHAMQ